ncbi:MAG: glucose-1-phosphate adenylyltransferase [Candidatus Omnitrophica bacterium]|nr:glucose-1-phosphate adenylyltransferase [Candidatus Omnitrophota bacterium]MCG2705376.1 glucose-1-phosphate adenylyltransferase [Candidatus Omnitrophota bacterium]
MKSLLCVVMGGGRGTRLYPLTKVRSKPAVPIFGRYRLIDIPVSNCLNSGFNKIYILTQFNSESLNKHISRTYKLDPFSKGFVDIMAAEQSMDDTNWFQGTADAVRRCLKHFNDPAYKYVLILAGDHMYKMDFRTMLRFHIEKDAQITIACNAVDAKDVDELGIMGTDDNDRINKFVEKPHNADGIRDMMVGARGKEFFLGSMGIYLFNKDALVDILRSSPKAEDFGREIIPSSFSNKRTYAFLFKGYWKDIGTIKSYYDESLALTEDLPPLDMFDEHWLIFSRPRYLPPSKVNDSHMVKSIVAEGAIILSNTTIKHSIIGLRSRIEENSLIEDSIIMGCDYYETLDDVKIKQSKNMPSLGIGKNCVIKNAIIDKNVAIGDGTKILNQKKIKTFDGENYCIRDGIVVIEKNSVIAPGTII